MNLEEMLEESRQPLFDADRINQGNNWVERASLTIEDLI